MEHEEDEDDDERGIRFKGQLQDMNIQEITAEFAHFGPVDRCFIKQGDNGRPGRNKEFGFVYFQREEDAQNLLSRMKFVDFSNNRRVYLEKSNRNKNLAACPIPGSNIEDLYQLFRNFGRFKLRQNVEININGIKIEERGMYEEIEFPSELNYNTFYVEYMTRSEAKEAKTHLDGTSINGQRIQVVWADSEILENSLHITFPKRKANEMLQLGQFSPLREQMLETRGEKEEAGFGVGRTQTLTNREDHTSLRRSSCIRRMWEY
ncbi:MAG: hypothetical protein EZS28_017630 [Streblomastix strix]|uniref:RRM domain-containing protein n=1 Tax=Streblomastix strix TaxID=222440 RepID=A0A5J4VVV8_9EUKA|nr:MAG: hypothetical protein EZS28_017630 [Streblomastix strix]